MLSIFLFYSPDRLAQCEITIACLQEVAGTDLCQKILVVDGEPNFFPEDFEVVTADRPGREFNWSAMWSKAVQSCQYDYCWYLDSDRILPKNYLELAEPHLTYENFIFTSNLFQFTNDLSLEEVKKYRDTWTPEYLKKNYHKFKAKIQFDPRFELPLHSSGKNPMSGNTMFSKQFFIDSGGVDPFYEHHGAFADTDFHMQCFQQGAKFIDLGVLELHLNHTKGDLDFFELGVLGLNNMVYYLNKWNLSTQHAVEAARLLKVSNPELFVRTIDNRLKNGIIKPLQLGKIPIYSGE